MTPFLKRTPLTTKYLRTSDQFRTLALFQKQPEKVVAERLNCHLENVNLHETFQSAYKKGHSTETALSRIHNDILCAIDDNECVILVLLDLSAAFDTVDHDILIERLKHRFGKALTWIKSYLSERTQFVKIGSKHSDNHKLCRGVPLGSVLGAHPVFNVHCTLGRCYQQTWHELPLLC